MHPPRVHAFFLCGPDEGGRWGFDTKRPAGAFAAALIDQCGLRGYRHGGAAVSDKHCGFVVNLGGATCADVLALCDEVRAIVKEKTGYDLEKEIRVVK